MPASPFCLIEGTRPAQAAGAHDKARFTRNRIGAFHEGEIAA